MSLFKRFFRDKDETNNGTIPPFKAQNVNIKAMGSNLQKRFSRGVQYNMKILIRGDRNVGKSALLNRLKGQDFVDQYIPTEEIEVACIHWTYKCTEDVVKVEVWDVVDKGRKKRLPGLKLENNFNAEESSTNLCLDAEFLDVYKGAHGVIMILDMTKSWTYNYVERELPKLAEDLPVLVLANHRDMGHHRTVSADQVTTLLESLPGYKRGLVKYWESSMKNGYGLVYIHRFFNIPFLMLQRDTLLKQLTTNEAEMKATFDGMDDFEECQENTYDNFIKSFKGSRAPSPPQKPSSLALHSSPSSQINSPGSPPSHVQHKGSVTPSSEGSARPPIHPPQARPIPGMEKLGLYPLPVPTDKESPGQKSVVVVPSRAVTVDKREIFDFVPDEQPELSMFLDDSLSPRSPGIATQDLDSSSEDDSSANKAGKGKALNPMVAVFQDDIDEEDVRDICVQDNGICEHIEPSSSDEQNETYELTSSTKSAQDGSSSTLMVRSVSEVSSTRTIIEEASLSSYSEIAFDASDLKILEQMSSRNDVDLDQLTEHSNSSTKKKKKHHHKQSENKDTSLKKKKKKSTRNSEEEMAQEMEVSRDRRHTKKQSSSTTKVPESADHVINGGSSDSLEKFLNE